MYLDAARASGPQSCLPIAAMSGEFWLWALCALLPALWLLSFLRTDTDLMLLWAAWLGRRPGEDLL